MRRPTKRTRRTYQRAPNLPLMRARTQGMQVVPRTMGPRAVTERKYFDTGVAAQVLAATAASWAGTEVDPAAGTLFSPTEGSDINNRIGRKVSVLKISMRGIIYRNGVAGGAAVIDPTTVRLILYMDKQTNAVQAQGEELMAGGTGAAARTTNQSFQSTANFGRFRVLKDISIPIAADTTGVYNGATRDISAASVPFKLKHRFRTPLQVRFNATNGGTIADIIDNSFHLLAHATDISPAAVSMDYNVRVVYVDV